MEQPFRTESIFIKIGVSLSKVHFPIVLVVRKNCQLNTIVPTKTFFLSAIHRWDDRIPLREMDHLNKFFGGFNGCGYTYLEFLFCHFKVIRLHGMLHDAAWSVPARSGKGPGYLYLIGRRPFLRVLWSRDWTTTLVERKTLSVFLFPLRQLLEQYILHCIRYWASSRNQYYGVRSVSDRNVQWYSICPQKKKKPTKQAFRCRRNLHGNM